MQTNTAACDVRPLPAMQFMHAFPHQVEELVIGLQQILTLLLPLSHKLEQGPDRLLHSLLVQAGRLAASHRMQQQEQEKEKGEG